MNNFTSSSQYVHTPGSSLEMQKKRELSKSLFYKLN